MAKVAPSFLSADFLNLDRDIRRIGDISDYLHLDVMDGVFVPNISFGFPVVQAISASARKPLDVHLMIVNPEKYAPKFAQIPGVEMVSFHLEACENPTELLSQLRSLGVKAGLVINPDVPVERLFPWLESCDFVLLMSVFAGFGGQKFIEDTYERVSMLKAEIAARGLSVEIEVDGGVGLQNAARLKDLGVDILVAGTAVFKAEDPAAVISELR